MIFSEFINQTLCNNNQIEWNYYNSETILNNIMQPNSSKAFIYDYFENGTKVLPMLVDPEIAENYINDYFTAGGKEYALTFDIDKSTLLLPDDRAIHTVSAFFLGLLTENCLNGKDTLCIDGNDFPFSYLWFLTCLYHDYGYCVTERENSPFLFPDTAPIPSDRRTRNYILPPNEYRTLARVCKILGIDLFPFRSCPHTLSPRDTEPVLENAILKELTRNTNKLSHLNKLRFNTNSRVCDTQYDIATTVRYFNYCTNELGKTDHGIIGGLLFYDKMVKNYMLSYIAAMRECNYTPQLNDFEYKNRHFCSKQLVIFSYIADCILSHNVFKQQENSRQVYEKYKLDALYVENFKKITYKDNPLLFILAVTDSIEPTKIYRNDAPVQTIINSINIEYEPASKEIKISCSADDIDINKIFLKAKELEAWTSVRCSSLKNDCFTLKLENITQ